MLDALPLLTSTRAARGTPLAQVDLGPAVLLAVLGNDDWSIIRRNGRILSQSFPAEHACTWYDMLRRRNNVSVRVNGVELELGDPHAFSRLSTAFAVRSAIAHGLIRVVKGAQNSRQTLEVLEAHFGDAILSIKVYLKRSLFKLRQDELQSCLDVTSQILVIADRLSRMDFELLLGVVILLLSHGASRKQKI